MYKKCPAEFTVALKILTRWVVAPTFFCNHSTRVDFIRNGSQLQDPRVDFGDLISRIIFLTRIDFQGISFINFSMIQIF